MKTKKDYRELPVERVRELRKRLADLGLVPVALLGQDAFEIFFRGGVHQLMAEWGVAHHRRECSSDLDCVFGEFLKEKGRKWKDVGWKTNFSAILASTFRMLQKRNEKSIAVDARLFQLTASLFQPAGNSITHSILQRINYNAVKLRYFRQRFFSPNAPRGAELKNGSFVCHERSSKNL